MLEQAFGDITVVLGLPERYRKRLRTTSRVECLNEETRPRDRIVRIYPCWNSVARILGRS